MHSTETVSWHHAAFCRLGLPIRAPRAAWQRSVGPIAVRLEPGTGGHGLPSGILLRLTLLHIIDAAVRSNTAVVELGETASVLAERIGGGIDARLLADQVERILGARITVALDGGPELGLFDARSRPRPGTSQWKASIRLNAGFLGGLAANAVPLDRGTIGKLHEQPLAFDAYAWIRASLHQQPHDFIATAPWSELGERFGSGAQDAASFRAAFEAALRLVFEADHSLALAVDEDGVSVRHAAEDDGPAAPDATAAGPITPTVSEAGFADPLAPPEATDAVADSTQDEPGPTAQPQDSGTDTEDSSDRIVEDTISLRSHMTGLPQVIWLRRGYGDDSALVGVTPGARFDPERLTVLAVEPIVMEVSGGLGQEALSRVSSWVMVNRDLIDDFWAGEVTSFAEIDRRLRKVPAAGWR